MQDRRHDCCIELFYRHPIIPSSLPLFDREQGWQWLMEAEENADPEEFLADDAEGEEWKSLIAYGRDEEVKSPDAHHQLRTHETYRTARAFALRAAEAVESLPEINRGTSSVVDFISSVMVAASSIGRGTALGLEPEELGGNIAYCKRGLRAANSSLHALREMREKHLVTATMYGEFIGLLTEVRDLIAVHIVNLREEFRRIC